MAKDDYDFLVFRILTYLYACFRRRCHFETTAFMKRVISPEVSEDYLVDVLRFMTREELIDGLTFVKAWGNDYTLTNDYSDMKITPQGIRYLLDNDKGSVPGVKNGVDLSHAYKDYPGILKRAGLEAVQKEIYEPIAETQHCKWKAVQGVVRRAAKLAWEVNPDAVRVMAVYPLTGCPSAVQFLEMVYNAVVRG